MAHIIKDRVKETTTSTGTGQILLNGAVTGFTTFAANLAINDTCNYCIDNGAGEWEIGLGTLISSTLLDRTSVVASSNGTSSVNFSAGTKSVFLTQPASAFNTLQSQIDSIIPEYGTFTPVLYGTTSEGVGIYNAQAGYYTKIGKLVYFSVYLGWTAHTGTGDMRIKTLPYAPKAGFDPAVSIYANALTYSGTLSARVVGTYIDILNIVSSTAVANTKMDTSATVIVTGVFSIA